MKKLLSVMTTLVVALAVAFVAEISAAGRTLGDRVDDAVITTQVTAKLTADSAADLVRVDVDTKNGTVYLNGSVPTAEHKARAEELARGTSGVQTVVNNLTVQPAAGRTLGETVDDAVITAQVKAKLTAETAANLVRVNVDTTNGTVYLNGSVQTAEHKARAEELARATRGVQTVVNNLAVQPR
jgi:hyperosmotically inducible protein